MSTYLVNNYAKRLRVYVKFKMWTIWFYFYINAYMLSMSIVCNVTTVTLWFIWYSRELPLIYRPTELFCKSECVIVCWGLTTLSTGNNQICCGSYSEDGEKHTHDYVGISYWVRGGPATYLEHVFNSFLIYELGKPFK